MNIIQHPSPNFDDRKRHVDTLVIHYTGMKTMQEAKDRLCDPLSKVSAHYLIDEDGSIYQLVQNEKRAWHAGFSFWNEQTNVNGNSIGIELVNPGHEHGYQKFTIMQYKYLIELCYELKWEYKIKDINIIGHSDIAPERKEDPGELFDWEYMAENSIGLWPKVTPERKDYKLTDFGYQFHDSPSIRAFQRHWRQNKIDGIWDEECGHILASLIESSEQVVGLQPPEAF